MDDESEERDMNEEYDEDGSDIEEVDADDEEQSDNNLNLNSTPLQNLNQMHQAHRSHTSNDVDLSLNWNDNYQRSGPQPQEFSQRTGLRDLPDGLDRNSSPLDCLDIFLGW